MTLPHGAVIAVATTLILHATAAVAEPAKLSQTTPPAAKAMLARVVKHVKTAGRKRAFGDFTARKQPFFASGMYVVCVDVAHAVVAHGGFPTYVGSATFFKNKDGTIMAPTIWSAATKGSGTLRYAIRDEETNNTVEQKIGYFTRINDDVCGVVAHDL